MADNASPVSTAPPKPKRSFFKKPSWVRNSNPADDDDPTAMFNGSKLTFDAIMAEREHDMAKERAERERNKHKRRRLSPGERSDSDHLPERHHAVQDVQVAKHSQPPPSPSPSRKADAQCPLTRSESAPKTPKASRDSAVVIDSSPSRPSGDTTPPQPTETATKQATSPSSAGLDGESGSELRELMREDRRKQSIEAASQDAHAHDPRIQIFITSRIPDTRPLIVTRKLSQRLQEVRHAWCQKQGFGQEMTDSVFFTFKGRRLFDVATPRSLGLSVDEFGDVHMKNEAAWNENSKVAVEAVTQDIFNEDKNKALHSLEPELISLPEPPRQPKKMKMIVRTKNFGEVKLSCGPETTFEKLAKVSAERLEIPPAGRRTYLLFDGEELDPSDTVAQLEDFEDGDALEMHFS